MRRVILALITGWLVLSGCSNEASKGYTVVFEGMPDVYSDRIFDNGVEVGRIVQRDVNSAGSVRMVVSLNEEWRRTSNENIAFYPRHGHLQVEHLQSFGPPLSSEAVLYGFTSRNGLIWFKLRTLMSERGTEARQQARILHAAFSTP
jgi:hypothetical protein